MSTTWCLLTFSIYYNVWASLHLSNKMITPLSHNHSFLHTNISCENNSPIETILLKYDAVPQLWDWCLYSLFACMYPPPNQHEFQTNSVKEDFTWTSPKSCTTNLLRRTNYNRTCLVLFINVYKIFGILG